MHFKHSKWHAVWMSCMLLLAGLILWEWFSYPLSADQVPTGKEQLQTKGSIVVYDDMPPQTLTIYHRALLFHKYKQATFFSVSDDSISTKCTDFWNQYTLSLKDGVLDLFGLKPSPMRFYLLLSVLATWVLLSGFLMLLLRTIQPAYQGKH